MKTRIGIAISLGLILGFILVENQKTEPKPAATPLEIKVRNGLIKWLECQKQEKMAISIGLMNLGLQESDSLILNRLRLYLATL